MPGSPDGLRVGTEVEIHIFQNMAIFHIKLKGIMNQQHGSKYFARRPPPPDPGSGHGVKREADSNKS